MVWEGWGKGNVPRGTISVGTSGRRGGDQKTTLRGGERKGRSKTVVAPRKPAIYRKQSYVGNLLERAERTGRAGRAGTVLALGRIAGIRAGFLDGADLCFCLDWKEGGMWDLLYGIVGFSLFHGVGFRRGRPARTLRPTHRAGGSYPSPKQGIPD